MKNKKQIGSYYTPKVVSDFLVEYLSKKVGDKKLNILEPSAGDGIFIKSLIQSDLAKNIKRIIAVEREKDESQKIQDISNESYLQVLNCDFLNYQIGNERKFQLVVGNPPYIKKNLLSEEQINLCEEIHKLYPQLSNHKIKNIWTAFLIRCINFLSDDGILAFVLPAELLQVKFASELRALILSEFERVEIFTSNELFFPESNGQDTVLLIAQRKAVDQGVFYCNINSKKDLIRQNFTLSENINIRDSKWTHHHLTTEEIELLEKLKKNIKTVDDFCSSKAGIVTAANDYFIVDEKVIDQYLLKDFAHKIVKRGSFINGSLIFGSAELDELIRHSKPVYLLDFNNSNIVDNTSVQSYIKVGEHLKLHERYKMSKRTNWFEVPNIGTSPEAFFFKRCHEYPKLIKNDANVLTTDSAYKIAMKKGYNIESLLFSFYNTVTLAFAELYGRYYGGGVLELTPNEFKTLPVPYVEINNTEFQEFVAAFKSKKSIKDICDRNDLRILKSIDPKITKGTISKLERIKKKLYMRRMKTN